MKRLHLKRIFVSICCLFISFNSISAGDIYVDATNGNDKANGTFNEPVKSFSYTQIFISIYRVFRIFVGLLIS